MGRYPNMNVDNYMKKLGFNTQSINAIRQGKSKIPGYTWHHHQEIGRMQLVDQLVHADDNYLHTGGYKLWGKGEIK